MTAPAIPAPAREATADTGTTPVAAPETTRPESIADAAARARTLLSQPTADSAPTDTIPPETVEEDAVDVAPEGVEEQPTVPLVVTGPGLRGEDGNDTPFEIEVSDEQSKQVLETWAKGYVRGEQARAIREEAQGLRDQADEIKFGVEIDPAGFMAAVIQNPNDKAFLFRSLAVEPGILEAHREWLLGVLDAPDALPTEKALIEAEGIKRREKTQAIVAEKREMSQNAMALVRTANKTIETMAPATYSDDSKEALYQDVLADLRQFARDRNLRTVDPRVIPGLIEKRLARYGVAPRTAPSQSSVSGPAAAGTKPTAPTLPTPETLRKARAAKRAAGSAPPGVGSPVATLPKPPAYDPTKKGTPIQQIADWGRAMIRGSGTVRPQ